MLKIITAVLIFCSVTMMGQNFRKIEKEIKALSGENIKDYWVALHNLDQEIAGGDSKDAQKNTIINLYKTAAMIHYHGYPVVQVYDNPAYTTPWLTWIHCSSSALKQYTFPIILEGRDKQQLPGTFFPDYFVGGMILDNYGLDMVYDLDFHAGGISPVARLLYKFEEDRHAIDLKEVQKLAEDELALLTPKIKTEIGKWKLLQHDNITFFSIVKIRKDLYLMHNVENGNKKYSRLKPAGNGQYEFVEGYGFYSLNTANGTLQFRDRLGNTVKTLLPIE